MLHVNQASFGANVYIPVNVHVTSAALQAKLNFETSQITQSLTLEVRGNEGVETSARFGLPRQRIMAAVNHISDVTGVKATLINSTNATSGITFNSVGFGTKAFLSVAAQAGTFSTKIPGTGAPTQPRGWTRRRGDDQRCGRRRRWPQAQDHHQFA